MEKCHRAYFYLSLILIKTWEREKRVGETHVSIYLHIWKPSIMSPLNMAPICVYTLQLGYPLIISHYYSYESLYSIDWLLFQSFMESVLVIPTLYRMILIKSMLPSQVICHPYMFKGSKLMLTIFTLVDLPCQPSLCQLFSIYLIC